jgi:PhnB protein
MQLNAYIMFDGNCRQAFEFYAKALGAKITMLTTYGEMPPGSGTEQFSEADGKRIVHVRLERDGWVLMGCDTHPAMGYKGIEGLSMSLQVASAAEADQLFDALKEGGTVTMPLGRTSWSERFGMLVDRFGLDWMVNLEGDAKPK